MEKQQTTNDVSRLIQGSMRPYDKARLAEGDTPAGAGEEKPRAVGRLKSLLSGETLLIIISVLLALAFLGLAASNFSLAGNFISIDSLFMTLVCLMLAGVFLFIPLLTLKEKGLLKRPFAGTDDAYVVDDVPAHFEGSTRLFLSVLGGLLLLTIIEVVLAYFKVPLHIMLTILIGLSLIKAALIMAYFMHLRFERLSLVLTLVPIMVVCICLLLVFFPDSFRSLNLRSTPEIPQAQTQGAVE